MKKTSQTNKEIKLSEEQVHAVTYVQECRKLMSNKEVLARMLKEYTPEFKNASLDQIPKYLGNDSDPNVKNLSEEYVCIEGTNVAYEISFEVQSPNSEQRYLIELKIFEDMQVGAPLIRLSQYKCKSKSFDA